MVIFLIRAAIYVATAALGLLVGMWLLDDFHLESQGFLVAVLVFAFAQSLLGPFIFRMTNRYIPAAIGGFGLISTLAALFVASLFHHLDSCGVDCLGDHDTGQLATAAHSLEKTNCPAQRSKRTKITPRPVAGHSPTISEFSATVPELVAFP